MRKIYERSFNIVKCFLLNGYNTVQQYIAHKYILADSRKLIPRRRGFQIFLIIFYLLEHKNRLFSLFYSCFVWENPFPKDDWDYYNKMIDQTKIKVEDETDYFYFAK